MNGHYEKDMYRQLEELMNRVDSMSQELKQSKKEFQWELKTQEIKLKEEISQERKQLIGRIEFNQAAVAYGKEHPFNR